MQNWPCFKAWLIYYLSLIQRSGCNLSANLRR